MEERKEKEQPAPVRVLRLFGLPGEAVQDALDALPEKWGVTAQCMTRGGETLAVLEAADAKNERDAAARLDRAQRSIQAACPDALYGEGTVTLTEATAQLLLARGRLLVCADANAGALLEPRLEAVPGAERMFDFGSQSYAHLQNRDKIAAAAQRCADKFPQDPYQAAAGRVQAARRLAEADLAAGCVPQSGGAVLLVGGKKGLWSRAVPQKENPALWLLDMIRRAACGLEQAEGTYWTRYGVPLPSQLAAQAADWPRPAPEASEAPGPTGTAGPLRAPERSTAPAAAHETAGAASPPDGTSCPVPEDTAYDQVRQADEPSVSAPQDTACRPASPPAEPAAPSDSGSPGGPDDRSAPDGGSPWVPERGSHALPEAASDPADGTDAAGDGQAPSGPPSPAPRRRRRWPLVLLLLVLLLAAAGTALWYYTGGHLELVLKWLGIREFTLSGASLL